MIWYLYRLLEQAQVTGSLATFATYAVALGCALPFVLRQAWVQRHRWRSLLAVALVSGWINLAYVLAVLQGEVMRVMLLFYLAPLWTIVFVRFILGERPCLMGYLVIGLSLAGELSCCTPMMGACYCLIIPPSGWLCRLGLALLSPTCCHTASATSLRARAACGSWAVPWPFAFPVLREGGMAEALTGLNASGWALIFATGLALMAATFSVQYGLAHTPAMQAIVILLTELVAAGLSSWWLAGEVMTAREWPGGTMIVTASLLSGKMQPK